MKRLTEIQGLPFSFVTLMLLMLLMASCSSTHKLKSSVELSKDSTIAKTSFLANSITNDSISISQSQSAIRATIDSIGDKVTKESIVETFLSGNGKDTPIVIKRETTRLIIEKAQKKVATETTTTRADSSAQKKTAAIAEVKQENTKATTNLQASSVEKQRLVFPWLMLILLIACIVFAIWQRKRLVAGWLSIKAIIKTFLT